MKRIGERYLPEMTVDMIFRYDRFGRGGDHTAFNEEGYAAVRMTTPNENFANQHFSPISRRGVSKRVGRRVTRINIAAAAAMTLAAAPGHDAPGFGESTRDCGGYN